MKLHTVCSVEDCLTKVYGRGLCQKHYTRWYRYGDVNATKPSGKTNGNQHVTPETATEADHAWAAGFTDGEGAVMLVRNSSTGQIYVHVRVVQTVEPPLHKLADLYGGSVKALDMDMPSRAKNTKQIWEWNIVGAKAVDALIKMRPYMMVKQDHAEIAIDFHNECFGVEGISDTRLAYFELMRELQHKGQHLTKEVK